jgi:adenylate cyclase
MPKFVKALVMGLAVGMLGIAVSLVPKIAELETSIGLGWLFNLRGKRLPPDEVVVISIDQDSSRYFDLPNDPRKWPRRLHAELIRNLAARGVRVMAFDVRFDEHRDLTQDRLLAEAIREAGNVVLFQYLLRKNIPEKPSIKLHHPYIVIERLVPPIPELAQAAKALAPFPLPKVPARVSQVWTFKRAAGGAPTLPVMAYQVYLESHLEVLRKLIKQAIASGEITVAEAMLTELAPGRTPATHARSLRQLFQTYPQLEPALINHLEQAPEPARPWVLGLISLYAGGDSLYLDFYGPPQSIRTIPYHSMFTGTATADLTGKAVFVGFSEQLQPEQKDGFYTVFSQPDGLDISGVEIAATTFANLLENRRIVPLPPLLMIGALIFWGLASGALLTLLPGASPLPAALAMAALGAGAAYYWFIENGTWLPTVIPLLFQLPVALVGALLWHYLSARKERQIIRQTFDYFLPSEVVDELIQDSTNFKSKWHAVRGVCLATDAKQYTRLSEKLEPRQLQALLNRYFAVLFPPVKKHGGVIFDLVGDSMMAGWWSQTSLRALHREAACRAAIEIIEAVEEFNRGTPQACLPTRIGLHVGNLVLGNVGAGDHYEYRPVGDIPNAASRIEGLNKLLGTQVLASKEVIQGLDSIVTREVGCFRVFGKSQPLVIHELLCDKDHYKERLKPLCAQFANALQTFQAQRWQEASVLFENIRTHFGEDGPTLYYLSLCGLYATEPPLTPWDGVITIHQK